MRATAFSHFCGGETLEERVRDLLGPKFVKIFMAKILFFDTDSKMNV